MSIAELLDYGLKEVPQQSEIRTETVETNNATTDSSKVFKFTIRNVGFLEGTSMLTFKLKNLTGANEDKFRLNLWSGAVGCIKNAHLRIGDYEVQNAQDVDRIAAMLNLNKSVLQRRNVLGHYLGNSLELKVLDGATVSRGNGTDATGKGQIVYVENDSGASFGTADNGTNAAINSLAINSTTSNNEKYGVPLSMIFPCLKGRSLPLFLFTDYNIQLEFEMNFSDKFAYNLTNLPQTIAAAGGKVPYLVSAGADTGSPFAATTTDVGFADVQLVVDYMLPPSSVINNFLEQTTRQGGYRFEFPEIAVVKKKLTAVPRSKELQEVEHRLGQTGKEVHSVVMAKRFVDYLKREGSTVVASGTGNNAAVITNINCENISIGALASVGTYLATPRTVNAVDVTNNTVTLNDNTQGGAFTDVAITFTNPNSMGLARKILQHQAIHGVDEEEYNVEVNGLDLYPNFVLNNASQYNQMGLVMGEDLVVPRPMYYNDPNAERQRIAPMEDGLMAQYKPLGADLSNGNPQIVGGGTMIMSGSPLIWKYKRRPRINGTGDGSVEADNKLGKAPDYRGEMDVSYYITHSRVVTVKKLPKGTSVMVSS